MRYSGSGVRSVGPVGNFFDCTHHQISNCTRTGVCLTCLAQWARQVLPLHLVQRWRHVNVDHNGNWHVKLFSMYWMVTRLRKGSLWRVNSLKLTYTLKMVVFNRNLLVQGSIFRGYFCFRERTLLVGWMDIASGKFGMIHDERYEERWQCLVFVFLFFLPFGSKSYFIEPIICRGIHR